MFLVRVDFLSPNYSKQRNRAELHHLHFWLPPDIKEAYNRDNGPLLRWKGGRMALVENNDPVRQIYSQPRFLYSAATVFTQRPDTDHLLAVGFDAETRDVNDAPNPWTVLSFDHIPNGRNYTYSSLGLMGSQQHLAAPGSVQWLPQLMPAIYDYQEVNTDGRPDPSTTQSAGLIGSLPLLLALAAFSAPRDSLAAAFACVQPGTWQPHHFHSGRSEYHSEDVSHPLTS